MAAAVLLRCGGLHTAAGGSTLQRTTTPRRLITKLPSSCCVYSALHTVVASEDPSGERYKNIVTSGSHSFRGDLGEAWSAGGTAPEPKDYALAGLALCTSMTIRLFADRMKWPLHHVQVEVQELGKGSGSVPDGLQMTLKLEGNLTSQQKERLLQVSAKCPVKQMMLGKMRDGIDMKLAP